jgi:hypothetical protein
MLLTREQILAASDLRTEPVPVPEWGGEVLVAVLPGAERWDFDVWVTKQKPESTEHVVRLLALCLVDEQGARLFTEDDVKALGAKSGVALARLFRVAMRLNAIGEAEVERLAGN